MTIPCGETIGHGETCSNCQEKSQAAEQERAAIVAWLRKNADNTEAQVLVLLFAKAIENGAHHRKATA